MTRQEAKESFYCIEAGSDGECLVDEIFDDFESRTCENCKYYGFKHCKNEESIAYFAPEAIYEDDGCNKWEQKK